MEPEAVYCHECGYDLRGQTLERCPECGFHYDRPGLEYLAEKEFYRCVGPLVDAVKVLWLALILSLIGLLPLTFPSRRGALPYTVAALVGVWIALLCRGLMLDWIDGKRPHVLEIAKHSAGELLGLKVLAIWFVASCLLLVVTIAAEAYLLATGSVILVGAVWTGLGLARVKDLPQHEGQPAVSPARAVTLTRTRRASIALLAVNVSFWIIAAELLC